MWFIIAIFAFFLLAFCAVIDKFLLTKSKIIPLSYAFYISVLGGLGSSLLLFFTSDFYFPKNQLFILIIGGAGFYFAIYFMFLAVRQGEVSKINPLIIGLTPLIVFLLSFFLTIESLSFSKLIGVILLVMGGYFLSQAGLPKTRLNLKIWFLVLLSCLMFALSNSFNKLAYNNLSFITAFIWLRWFSLITALIFTILAGGLSTVLNLKKQQYKIRARVSNFVHWLASKLNFFREKEVKTGQKWLIFGSGQLLGAIGVFSMQYAIKLGNVILVTALNGLQFFFVIFIVYFLSKFHPQILKENIASQFIKEKIFWSLVLFLGVILILI